MELKKLGLDVAKSTVERYQPRERRPTGPGWKAFLKLHSHEMASMDFFVVPTVGLKVLFVLVILGHDRRRVLHCNVTESPTAEWTAQQLIEAFPFDTAPRFLLRDGDAKFGHKVRRKLEVMGIRDLVTAPASPWQNAYVERLIGTIRRELSLEGDSPNSRPVRLAERAAVVEFPAVHGLHHYYLPAAA